MNCDDDYFGINLHQLDKEWQSHPDNVHTVGCALADAKRDLRQAEAELELVDAELYVEINKDPTKFDLPKTTVDLIKAAVTCNQRHIDAQNKVLVLKHSVDVHQVDFTALEHKKYGLQDMVKLFGLDYFAIPTAVGVGKEHFDELSKKGVRKSIRRKESILEE